MASTIWGASASWSLTALPLFIWMGEILFRTRISEDMFRGLAPWVEPLPGRLMHTNVVGCGIFAADLAARRPPPRRPSAASPLPELAKRGYDERMAIGSLAGAGTLGLLIPPSIIMIVYGVAADVSVARLFVAGVLPGIMLMAAVLRLHRHLGAAATRAARRRREAVTTLAREALRGAATCCRRCS